jgi:polyhydroxyalkanoate synthesis regulator phasin
MPPIAVALAVFSALASPGIAYFVATRRLSGKITTSEAADLWKESSAIRDDYRGQLQAAWGRIKDLEADLRTVRQENEELRTEINRLKRTVNGTS